MQSTDETAAARVVVVRSVLDYEQAARTNVSTHIVVQAHISFVSEFGGDNTLLGLQQSPVQVAVSPSVLSVRGNCTAPPATLTELGIPASQPMLDLLPGQCVLVAGSRGSYLFSTDVWIDGMYFKQVHEGDSDPIGGAMNILSKAWITDSTFDWGEPNTASCTQCTVWEDGGFFVEGQVYMKGFFSNTKSSN